MTGPAPPSDQTDGVFLEHMAKNLVQNSDVAINLGATLVITTEDKIKLAVHTHLQRMAERSAWMAPLGILLTIAVTFPTTDFKAFWILSADSWRAMFVMGALLALFFLIKLGWRALKAPSEGDFLAALRVRDSAGQVAAPHVPTPSTASADGTPVPAATPAPAGGNSLDLRRVPQRLLRQRRLQRSLRELLLAKSWSLIFNASTGASKPISFNEDGTIGLGRNQNEDRWELVGERLVILNPVGSAHSRFTYDPGQECWTQTSDIDTPRARDQRLVRLPEESRYNIKFT